MGTAALSTAQPHGPGGTGSLLLQTDGSDGQIIQFARVPIPLVTVDQFTAISWDFYQESGSDVPRPKIEYWWVDQAGTLVYQGNITATPGTWQTVTVDFATDLWYSTEFGSGDKRTLAEWQIELAGVPSNFVVIGFGTTVGVAPATVAYADMVHIATTKSDDTWDFEGDQTDIPQLPVPDIAITKTLDTAGPYTAGDTIQYTLTVSNAGPDAALDTFVADIPTNLTITSATSANCTELPCAIPSMAVGASEVITVMATIDAGGAFDNAAGAYALVDPDESNNIDNTDNGGVAEAAPFVPAKPIPTMPGWALILLAMLIVGVVFVRRKQLT